MSNRTTSQDSEKVPETRMTPDFSKFNVCDSFCKSTLDSKPSSGSGEDCRRISRQQLEEISARLGERDFQVITSVQRYRYMMTSQLQRLHFTDAAALRAASRALKKLRELGLIDTLSRRIGGVRAGSGSLVWHITHAGERLIYPPHPYAHPDQAIL